MKRWKGRWVIDELCVRRGVCGGVRQMGDVHGLESKHWDGLQLINAVPFISCSSVKVFIL